MGKAILFSAPSGCGKTTIINELMKYFDCFDFSISATSRAPRGTEQDGKDYYFLTHEEFKRRVDAGDFLEWEEVYQGTCYGTLKSEIERIWAAGRVIVAIVKRLARSAEELKRAPQFDVTIVNDDLGRAVDEARRVIERFLDE